jgi:predicted GNAT family acetyltransferase
MSIDPGSIRLEGGRGGGRYVHRFADGSEAELTFFERPPGTVTIAHTGTPPRHRGQGVAATLVARAVEDFRAAGQKVIPACPFAASVFAEHPEWSDLLRRR